MNKGLLHILATVLAGSFVQAGAQTAITLNENNIFQTIDNFAASDCWNSEFVGRYFSQANKEKVAQWLFSTEVDALGNPLGIGLSSWRVNLGAGSAAQGDMSGIEDETRRADCFLQADGTYDWTRCPGQQYFMQKAREYGVKDFVLFSNSAPVYFTKNGKALCDATTGDANLKDDKYDDFAEFLATSAKHFADQGYNISHISPVNEPSWEWTDGQEGSHWTNECIATLTRQLDQSISNRQLNTQIILPEACAYYTLFLDGSDNHINAFWNSANTDTYLGNLTNLAPIAATHSYNTVGTNYELEFARTLALETATQYGLKLYQTEWSMLETAPSAKAGFPDGGYNAATHMDMALYLAKVIQCDLTLANVSSWSYWTAMAREQWGHKNRFYLIRLNATGDTGTESYAPMTGRGVVTDDPNLWALGNFSRFVRPGYKRIDMTGANELNGLLGSAYLSPDGKHVVSVIVNMGNDTRSITLSDDQRTLNGLTINKYVTDASHKLQRDASLDTSYNGQSIEIAPRSITTITLDAADDEAIGDVNGDGSVDVTDINILTNVVLGIDDAAKYGNRADVTQDGIVDVSDINAVIGIILGA